jgi:hypothetical protein
MWKEYKGASITGTLVQGDPESPPTRWYNHLYLVLFGWKVTVCFQVSEYDAKHGYHVGYVPFNGKAMAEVDTYFDRQFRMKIGHEDCTFFAINRHGKEIPLKIVHRITKEESADWTSRLH